MTMNNEFYEILNEQISHRVEAEGDRIILRNPALNAQKQIEQIEGMLEKGIDVLILTPVNADGLKEVLTKARTQSLRTARSFRIITEQASSLASICCAQEKRRMSS